MKCSFLLLMLFLYSCSQDNGVIGNPKTLPGISSGKYLLTAPDNSHPYQSEIVNIIEIDGNIMTYTLGSLNDYSKDVDGNPRPGTHPDPSFLVNTSVYELTKTNNQMNFRFLGSACDNMDLNPHDTIIPVMTEAFYQLNDKLLVKLDNKIVEFSKEESKVNSLKSIKQNVFCNGEVEHE